MNSVQSPTDLIGALDRHAPAAWLFDLGASVQAGFPSPAQDLGAKRIDLTAELVRHPQAIFDNDMLIVDRAVEPHSGHVVIAVIEGDFVCKTLLLRAGRMKLKAANPGFPDVVPREGQTVEIRGVVTAAIKQMPR